MSSPSVAVLEQVTCVAVLGIRFWDVAAFRAVGAGLTVEAYPVGVPELRTTAVVGRGGIYSFHGLPGMRRDEIGLGDDAFWQSNPPQAPFTVEVADAGGQYLPFRLSVLLPVRGVFGLFESPFSTGLTPDATWIPVFSTPARPVPGAMAVARAQLLDTLAGTPAAWAFVTVRTAGQPPAVGVADQRGIVAVQFAYPEPRNFALGSPLRTGGVKWVDQSWPVAVNVLYAPGRINDARPELSQTLGQPAAAVNPAAFTLLAGQELSMKSVGPDGREISDLLLTPAGSPL
ncbi:MAG: hypothetical protein M3N54_10000 [Acidobacteriota bacterium]|nr:hypothetical protein [Acidobacteriota bacterium]